VRERCVRGGSGEKGIERGASSKAKKKLVGRETGGREKEDERAPVPARGDEEDPVRGRRSGRVG